MPSTESDQKNQMRLRLNAEVLLKAGTPPPGKGWVLGTDALALLYRLASSPDTAADGLKLLHELQTHQVELDLQHEQLEANERASAEDISHYRVLYEHAPVAYFIVGKAGAIIDSNLAGSALLGVGRDDLGGAPFARYLAVDSRPAFASMLEALQGGEPHASSAIQLSGIGGRLLDMTAAVAPGGEAVLVVVCG